MTFGVEKVEWCDYPIVKKFESMILLICLYFLSNVLVFFQAEEAIVVESAKMQFSGRAATLKSNDDVQDTQQQQPMTSHDARQMNGIAANQQSRRANR